MKIKTCPTFTVLLSRGIGNGQGVYSKLWSNGFLDSIHQGVQFSKGEDPVLVFARSRKAWIGTRAGICWIIWRN
jgi:hypothetical protein